mgnify:CR=1 FL=1
MEQGFAFLCSMRRQQGERLADLRRKLDKLGV